MRLIGPAGPVAGAGCAVEVERGSTDATFLGRGVTDREGRLVVKGSATGTLHVLVWLANHDHASFEGTAEVGYNTEAMPASYDLGAIPLREAPALVSGTVTMADGSPFTGVEVTVHLWVEGMCGHGLPGPGPFYYYIRPLMRFATRTDRHGGFAIRGSSDFLPQSGCHLALAIVKPGYVPDPGFLQFIFAGQTVHIVLKPGG